ncbi:hypothetical protein AB4Z38_02000 [Arthrobacter sp. 2RAF6]|uniref:hypothetical protein n=1 Tax=Arthrobacter sp. 2RAF6 TaxID=3233002 RepID=UPI003F93F450
MISVSSLKLRTLPDGYAYFGVAEGDSTIEFHDDPDQLIVRYKTGSGFAQAKMLSICYSPAGAALTCVETKPPIKIKLGKLSALYFDGHWVPGPGSGQWDTIVGPVHWDTDSQHSLAVSLPSGASLAIRSSPQYLPGLASLLGVARSIPVVEAAV